MNHERRLEFGIYPLGTAGTPTGLAVGPPDDHDRIRAALADLGDRVVPRTYLVDMEPGGEAAVLALADRYAKADLLGHVTIGCLRDANFDTARWSDLVRTVVRRHGGQLESPQITDEPNLSFMDGSKPNVVEALVSGVLAAKDEARTRSVDLDVGFGSVPAGPATVPTFWKDLNAAGGANLVDALDFAHNIYVDVFEDPVDAQDIPERVDRVLRYLRRRDLEAAGIPDSVPIRIGENGWPTGTNALTGVTRSYEQQAEVIGTVVRRVHDLATELNVTHFTLFGLRDADSAQPDIFHQFGIVRDDYTPKPAYATFRGLIRELGV